MRAQPDEATTRLVLVGSNVPPQGGSGAQQLPGGRLTLALLRPPGPSGGIRPAGSEATTRLVLVGFPCSCGFR
jgi:hypothetical protein